MLVNVARSFENDNNRAIAHRTSLVTFQDLRLKTTYCIACEKDSASGMRCEMLFLPIFRNCNNSILLLLVSLH